MRTRKEVSRAPEAHRPLEIVTPSSRPVRLGGPPRDRCRHTGGDGAVGEVTPAHGPAHGSRRPRMPCNARRYLICPAW